MRLAPCTVICASLLAAAAAAQPAWLLSPGQANGPTGATLGGAATDGTSFYFFGGHLGPASAISPNRSNELWRYDGVQWTNLTPASGSPPARERHAMTWDLRRGVLVVFGGRDLADTPLNDTWEWSPAGGWTQRVPAVNPSPRYWTRMFFDSRMGRTVLFGGYDNTNYYADTWLWDGVNWTLATPVTSPGPRARHAIAYDLAGGRALLFGGTDNNPNALRDTWLWSGGNWTQAPTSTIPYRSGCLQAAMSYDLIRSRFVMAGGFNSAATSTPNGYLDQTWEYDGTDWINRGTFSGFAARAGAESVYVPALQRSYLFGGFNSSGPFPNPVVATIDNQLWEYQTNAIAAFQESATALGCPTSLGAPPTLTANALPWVGEVAQVAVGNVPAGAPGANIIGVQALSLPLTSIGAVGCFLHVGNPLILPALPGPTLAIPVPANTALGGVGFFLQAAVLDPGANPGGIATSARGDAVIGVR